MDEYRTIYEQFGELAASGMPAADFYAAVRGESVSTIHAVALLRDYYEMSIKESAAIHKAYTGYSNVELLASTLPDYPTRGDYCPKCRIYIPFFTSISPETERRIRLISDWTQQMDELQKLTGCPSRWAKIWLNHPDGPAQQFGHPDAPPCPECGKQLRTSRAKQCVECGSDLH